MLTFKVIRTRNMQFHHYNIVSGVEFENTCLIFKIKKKQFFNVLLINDSHEDVANVIKVSE